MQSVDLLSNGGGDEHAPNLENRVAYQWRDGQDTVGYLHSTRRDEIVLRWLAEAVSKGSVPRATLDVGCAYGNYTLMLNARLDRNQDISLHAVDLHEPHLAYGRAFAEQVPGYAYCHFTRAPTSKRSCLLATLCSTPSALPMCSNTWNSRSAFWRSCAA